ncbi:MAG: UDP-N-acetylmuramoyl-tripeptide--D-alanyl-D-alanine ligase [Acidimicrobiales bacterium]|nr:UDP-N-acetylmuramoyl-tripeptide--D-alanyl-D-alanine ligase [Acidimicrobiales bacterium]
MRLTLADLAAATGGTVTGGGSDAAVEGLGVDSRALVPGRGFVALVAERDGHDFAPAAVAAGAAAVVASRPLPDLGVPVVEVADTSAALLDAGRLARSRLADRVVGITGSVGKTSTKDLLAALLAVRWPTAASDRSFNNEIGVPLTLAGAPAGTEATVVEMGARGAGHVALLCSVARPTAAIVTRVAGVHLETFRTVDDVARGKAELVEALPVDGLAVLNADDERVAAMRAVSAAPVLTFGVGPGSDADVCAERIEVGPDLRPSISARSPWGAFEVRLAVHGAHQVANAVAAAGCALALGVDVDDVVDALARAEVSAGRMQVRVGASGATVVDDAYNANPTSVRAALDALAAVPGPGARIAVLGLMAELGPDESDLHRGVAAHAASLGLRVVTVGTDLYGLAGADAVPDVDAAVARVGPLAEGDVVLVKGSRVARLERVVDALVSPR